MSQGSITFVRQLFVYKLFTLAGHLFFVSLREQCWKHTCMCCEKVGVKIKLMPVWFKQCNRMDQCGFNLYALLSKALDSLMVYALYFLSISLSEACFKTLNFYQNDSNT